MKDYFCVSCGRKHNGKHSSKYCRKHQWQLSKFGRLLDNNPRTKFDYNDFRFKESYVEFDTYLSSGEIHSTYIIDIEDYPLVSKYKWNTNQAGYARTSIKGKGMLLHRLIMIPKEGQQVDHINTDILDNRKSNLRLCNNSLNVSNRKGYNALGVKGVEKSKQGKYSAYFRIDGKQYHSNMYDSIEEASFARFILEQKFREETLHQFHEDLHHNLSEETKSKIIDDINSKFDR